MLTKRVKVEKKFNPNTNESEFLWWEASIKMLNDSEFLSYLIGFKETIDNIEE